MSAWIPLQTHNHTRHRKRRHAEAQRTARIESSIPETPLPFWLADYCTKGRIFEISISYARNLLLGVAKLGTAGLGVEVLVAAMIR